MKEVTIQLAEGRHLAIRYRENTSDRAVINQIWKAKDYDILKLKRAKEFIGLYRSIVQSGATPLIIDAGANIGASALYFSEFYKGSKVIAIEPESGNHALLEENTRGYTGIECLKAALSSSDGEINVLDPGQGSWGFRTSLQSEEIATDGVVVGKSASVSVNTIIKKEENSGIPFIAKIDIEGGERELFSKNLEWVDKFPIIIIELHDWLFPGEANSLNFLRCIANLKRDFIFHGENIFSLKNQT